jgi:sulfate adenylyltransferase subunit 1
MDILRFITAGNVDDGKSTLIGRLLYDTHNIKTDVLQSVSGTEINLAFITDGLRSEREQGITIDVAYKYFTTKRRKYIITDAPGHFQYTKNLVTGASGVDVMIILIDAQNGITDQARRHLLVASFLKLKQIVVAINKMDLEAYDEDVFNKIKNEFAAIAGKLGLQQLSFIPVSALCGDNISLRSGNMEWYKGGTLLQYLEDSHPATNQAAIARYSVQYVVNAPYAGYGKGYAGKMLSGTLAAGDGIGIYPAGTRSVVSKILQGYDEVQAALAGRDVVVYLENDAAAGRGDVFAHPQHAPECGNSINATLCWLDSVQSLDLDKTYFLRINGQEAECKIIAVINKIDVHTYDTYSDSIPLGVNQFAHVTIETKKKIVFDRSGAIPATGRGALIDMDTNYTCAAFVV